MKTKYLIFIFLLYSNPVFAQKTSLSELDYQLYSILINEWFCVKKDSVSRQNFLGKWKKREIKELVIRRKTNFGGIIFGLTPSKDSLSKELIDGFWQELPKEYEIKAQYLNPCIKITLFDSLAISKKHLGKFWKKFYRKYPHSNGIVELSPIAYDFATNQALLGISIIAYDLVAGDYLVIFENKNGKWRIRRHFMVSQS